MEEKSLVPVIVTFGIAGLLVAWSIRDEHPDAAHILEWGSIGYASFASLLLNLRNQQTLAQVV